MRTFIHQCILVYTKNLGYPIHLLILGVLIHFLSIFWLCLILLKLYFLLYIMSLNCWPIYWLSSFHSSTNLLGKWSVQQINWSSKSNKHLIISLFKCLFHKFLNFLFRLCEFLQSYFICLGIILEEYLNSKYLNKLLKILKQFF